MGFTGPDGVWVTLWDYRAVPGSVADIVAQLADHDIAGVAIKTHDMEWGSWLVRNQTAEFVQRCHAAGIKVAGWGYTGGDYTGTAIGFEGSEDFHHSTIELETDNIARSREAGVDCYFFDPEMEVSSRGQADPSGNMIRLLDTARRKVGADFPLGSYNVPRVGGGFPAYPLQEQLDRLDFFSPQVYCVEWGIPEQIAAWLKRGFGVLTDTGVPARMGGKPVYPELDAADDAGHPAAPGYFLAAAQLTLALGGRGVSLWHYGLLAPRQWLELKAVAALFRAAAADAGKVVAVDPPALPPPAVEAAGPDPISAALTGWYRAQPAQLQGNLGNDTYFEADVDFSSLIPEVQGAQRGIFGEYLAAWYHPTNGVLPIHRWVGAKLEQAGHVARR